MLYLKKIIIENVGPLENLRLQLPFTETGLPKPIILVGKNGSGKTICLSNVVDAFYEFGRQAFSDLLPSEGLKYHYFKVSGNANISAGKPFGFSFLKFSDGEEEFQYIEKSGEISYEDCKSRTEGLLEMAGSWPLNKNYKAVTKDSDYFQRVFPRNTFCFFPSNRHELPHWFNVEITKEIQPEIYSRRTTDRLGKPILIDSSFSKTKEWLLDLVIDHFMKLDVTNIPKITEILRVIMDNPLVEFGVAPRTTQERLAVQEKLGDDLPYRVIAPNLSHMSAGQAVLLGLFCTIIRYSDLGRPKKIEDIEGIVLIDEIDLHIHPTLQKMALPKLLTLFPKVQFIISTHSPYFLLGMEDEFGREGFQIIELPEGLAIDIENFTEFRATFEYYKESKLFRENFSNLVKESEKVLVFVEGETDEEYWKKATNVLGMQYLLDQVVFKSVGMVSPGCSKSFGKDALNRGLTFLEANSFLIKGKAIFLYDCDSQKEDIDIGNLYVRGIPMVFP